MAEKNSGDDNLAARIAELQKRIELLEAGSLGTRERVVRDNKPILIDTTKQTIERSKQWMRDLQALKATAPQAKVTGKRGAPERGRAAVN
jgi:hypothetical protein